VTKMLSTGMEIKILQKICKRINWLKCNILPLSILTSEVKLTTLMGSFLSQS
jgi:hypothetical protein